MSISRTSYIDSDLLDRLPFCVLSQDQSTTNGVTKFVQKQYDITNILKILWALRSGKKTFSKLYQDSQIRMKSRYMAYLNFCVTHHLIINQKNDYTSLYTLTGRGATLLDLFTQ